MVTRFKGSFSEKYTFNYAYLTNTYLDARKLFQKRMLVPICIHVCVAAECTLTISTFCPFKAIFRPDLQNIFVQKTFSYPKAEGNI